MQRGTVRVTGIGDTANPCAQPQTRALPCRSRLARAGRHTPNAVHAHVVWCFGTHSCHPAKAAHSLIDDSFSAPPSDAQISHIPSCSVVPLAALDSLPTRLRRLLRIVEAPMPVLIQPVLLRSIARTRSPLCEPVIHPIKLAVSTGRRLGAHPSLTEREPILSTVFFFLTILRY